jgi:hypothetical protein
MLALLLVLVSLQLSAAQLPPGAPLDEPHGCRDENLCNRARPCIKSTRIKYENTDNSTFDMAWTFKTSTETFYVTHRPNSPYLPRAKGGMTEALPIHWLFGVICAMTHHSNTRTGLQGKLDTDKFVDCAQCLESANNPMDSEECFQDKTVDTWKACKDKWAKGDNSQALFCLFRPRSFWMNRPNMLMHYFRELYKFMKGKIDYLEKLPVEAMWDSRPSEEWANS